MIKIALQKKLHTIDGEMQLHIECAIEGGKLIAVYGSSGAGKTSVLRMLAGFLKPDVGYIKMNDEIWFDSSKLINIAPQLRKTGFVFQDYALFPNMDVRKNIAFGLSKNDDKNIVDELLDLTGLSTLASRKIQTLSGGQKQRVALARAIAARPTLLLLDEPLSAIDNNMRQQLQTTLLEVHQRFKLTTILVSHDMDEIIKLSDEIIYLKHGAIKQHTTPAEFFLEAGNLPALTGNIVSIEDNNDGAFATVLLKNRIMKINANGNYVDFSIGERVEIIYENSVPIIRKL